MITQDEQDLEEVGNMQLKAMYSVLKDLRELSGASEWPHEFYWFRYAEYVQVDRYGCLDVGRSVGEALLMNVSAIISRLTHSCSKTVTSKLSRLVSVLHSCLHSTSCVRKLVQTSRPLS